MNTPQNRPEITAKITHTADAVLDEIHSGDLKRAQVLTDLLHDAGFVRTADGLQRRIYELSKDTES